MVKETLKKALEDAVGYYNNGMSANDAVVKSASDHDLTIDQTDRVVESFNTAKTINYYDKNASDRTGGFDLADKKSVTLSLFGKDTRPEKKACVLTESPDPFVASFYTTEPDKSGNRKNVFAEKRASLLDFLASAAEEKWAHGYSDKTLHDMASDSFSVIKSASADIDSALGTIDSYLWTATEKIASDLARGPYDTPADRANLFKAACPHSLVIREVSKISPLLKAATGGSYVKTNVVDTAPVDDLLKEADDIMAAVKMRRELREKRAAFEKKAAVLKETLLNDTSMGICKKASCPESYIHAPTTTKKAVDTSMVLDALNGNESRKKVNERIRDDARGALLADLLSSDPILQDADPRQVSSIYKSLVATSPRVSLNKEVVRSVLRGAVNSVAISPSDSKVLTDVDKGVQVAFGGLSDKAVER